MVQPENLTVDVKSLERVSIIIPAYNEEKSIGEVLRKVKDVDLPVEKEIVVIDDGSTDGTAKVAERFEGIKLIRNPVNRGKGYSLKRGVENSTGTIIVFQDADLEYDPEQLKSILEPLIKRESEVVYGSRFKGKARNISAMSRIGNMMLTSMTNLLFGSGLSDMETCYKAFRRHVVEIEMLRNDRFEIEAEITAHILKRGYRIKEVPINYDARSVKEGKKITVTDGIKTAVFLIKYRFLN